MPASPLKGRARWLASAAVASIFLAGAAVPAGAEPKPPPADAPAVGSAKAGAFGSLDLAKSEPKGQPSAAQGAGAAGGCNLRSDADRSSQDEWLSCISVGASLDRLPAVGEQASLLIDLRAARDLDADVSVTLPPNLEWVDAPDGLVAGHARSDVPEMRGIIATAKGSRSLRPGGASRIIGRVRAIAEGAAQIDVRATSDTADGVDAGADSVFLTVGDSKTPSREAITAAKVGSVVRVNPGLAVRATDSKPQSVGTAGLAQPTTNAPCDSRVTGGWGYSDQTGAWRNSMNFQVQVWNKNATGDSLLATGITAGNGTYDVCFDSQAEGWPDSGTADIYVKFVSENALWRVQRGGNPMEWATGVTWDVTPGSTTNLGTLTTGDPALHRGLHAFDEANDVWLWIPKPRNSCFDQNDSSCRQLRINWAPDSTDGTYYSTGANDVHLAANDPNSQILVGHEIGHAVMDDIYNDAFPSAPNCNPHSITGTTSAGCAWTEGWAEWFPATIYNDPFFRWADGGSLNLENTTWGNGWNNGDTTEGRVAAAMIDLTDSSNEGAWDRYGEGSSALWSTFTRHVSANLGAFWSHRAADGFAVGDTQLGGLFQNTIDYGFRDPLANYVELSRPNALVAHNYRFNATTNYWAVAAVRSGVAIDYDISLYDDRAQASYLGGSTFGGNAVDFVAVDSNRRPLGDYYPRVRRFSGTASYRIELAQGSEQLGLGTQAVSMSAGDIVKVRDVFMTAGVRETFRVTSGSPGQDSELFLLGSDANPATWIRSRGSAVAAASAAGPGAPEQFSYTPAASGWYGIVLINKAGTGNYSLTRSRP